MEYTKTHEFNKRISLQAATEVKSNSGQVTKTYTTFTTVWSKARTIGGQEKLYSNQVTGTLNIEFSIRYSSETAVVKVYGRILMGSRIFDIKDVRNLDEKNIEIRMLATEVKK